MHLAIFTPLLLLSMADIIQTISPLIGNDVSASELSSDGFDMR
jgi:hypothetical protein